MLDYQPLVKLAILCIILYVRIKRVFAVLVAIIAVNK